MAQVVKKDGLRYRNAPEPICRGAVYHLLTNPAYYGMVRWNGPFVVGKHEPLVTKKLFDRVQEKLGGQDRPGSNQFAFTRLGECGHCGSSITAERKTKKLKNGKTLRYVYYHCTGHKNGGKVCKGSYIREERDNQTRRKLVDLVVSKVVISGGRVVSNLREPFSTLSKLVVAAGSGKSRPKWLGC